MPPHNHLLIIAIGDYTELSPLRGPNRDADAIRDILHERYDFTPERTRELRDKAATGGAIRRAFGELADVQPAPDERLLIYYAGHGYRDRWRNGFWIPADGGRDEYEQRGWISNSAIRAMIRELPFKHVLLLCDSCFSGDLLDRDRDLMTARQEPDFALKAEQLVSREVISSGSSEPVSDMGLGGHSPFAFQLLQTLKHSTEPWLDRLRLYDPIRSAIAGQTPLEGALPGAGHQPGGAFLLYPVSSHPPRPTAMPAPSPKRLALLDVISEPPGADFWLDGRKRGQTPLELDEIPWGKHAYRARLEGETKKGRFEIDDFDHELILRFDKALTKREAEAKAKRKAGKGPKRKAKAKAGLEAEERRRRELEPTPGQDYTVIDLGLEFVWTEALDMWVGKYAVTNDEYRDFQPAHESQEYKGHSLNGDRQPVVYVNYEDATDYAKWLTKREREAGRLPFECRLLSGWRYRLPLETEWESFARCGDDRKYPWGDEWPPRYGNYAGKETRVIGFDAIDGYNDGHVVTCDVEASGKNDWGLYGVGGNVSEMCLKYTGTFSSFGAWRGASWNDDDEYDLRVSYRVGNGASNRYSNRGFRLVLSR